MTNVQYTKVDEGTPEVVSLATSLKVPAKEIATMINQDRYRKAYNRLRNAEMSALRKLVKEHPELVKEIK